jgi:aminomuconate-semialdehyde/2-hydroxymuconate-6-semialdehyde dehydrogenase
VCTELLRIQNFIDGQFVEPTGGKYLDISSRRQASLTRKLQTATRAMSISPSPQREGIHRLVKKTAAERSRYLLRIADLIERDPETFARAESIDTGKPLTLARTLDIPRAIANFRFFATAILHTESEAHITDNVAFNYTLRQPRGIAGLISPWNLPLYLPSRQIAGA